MENKAISLDGWELVDAKHTTVSTIATNYLQMNGQSGHDGYLRKAVMVPKATNVLLSATSYRSHPMASDVRVGISAQWGHWAGRVFSTSNPTYLLNEHAGGTLMLMLRFAGEWGSHTCQFRDIKLSYEPVEPEPEPPPDSGIIGQIAAVLKRQSDTVETLIETNTKIVELLSKWENAQDWVNAYNRSLE